MKRTSDRDVLLLDTHVWLWLVAGSSDLSTEARNAIERATAVGALRIAAISLWEVVLLASHGRIVLGKSIGPWLEEALADPGPTIDPLSPQTDRELRPTRGVSPRSRRPAHRRHGASRKRDPDDPRPAHSRLRRPRAPIGDYRLTASEPRTPEQTVTPQSSTSLLTTLSRIGLPSRTLRMFSTAATPIRSTASRVTPATCGAAMKLGRVSSGLSCGVGS